MSATTTAALRYRLFRAALRAGQVAARPTAALRGLPDFLVVGGQRCGTTSLYRYLDQHPAVFFPRLTKGVHWFDEEFQRSEAWYRSNFPLDVVRQRRGRELGTPTVVGEACPYYLFHPSIPSRIAEHLPAARVVAILRDPIERAWSQYHHERGRGYETLEFEAALDAEKARLDGADTLLARRGTRHLSHQHHSYLARGRYAEQLQRLWAAIPRQQTLVLYTADLEREPQAVMDRLHSFLGVPPHPTVAEERWNRRSKPDLADRLVRRLRAGFAESDEWLRAHLDAPPPWLQ